MQFADQQGEVTFVVVHQVPGIGRELGLHLGEDARRPEELDRVRPAERDAQQPVETHEVVHVGVRDEHMADAQQLAWRQRADVAEIEEQGALFEEEIDQEPGVAKRRVDELKGESRAHAGGNVGYTHYRRLASLRTDAVTDLERVRAGASMPPEVVIISAMSVILDAQHDTPPPACGGQSGQDQVEAPAGGAVGGQDEGHESASGGVGYLGLEDRGDTDVVLSEKPGDQGQGA
jgi:hypothetical protein